MVREHLRAGERRFCHAYENPWQEVGKQSYKAGHDIAGLDEDAIDFAVGNAAGQLSVVDTGFKQGVEGTVGTSLVDAMNQVGGGGMSLPVFTHTHKNHSDIARMGYGSATSRCEHLGGGGAFVSQGRNGFLDGITPLGRDRGLSVEYAADCAN